MGVVFYHHFRDIHQNFLDVSRRNNENHLTQLAASTHLKKYAAQIRLFSQVGNKMKIIQKHNLEHFSEYSTSNPHDNDEKQPISCCWNNK